MKNEKAKRTTQSFTADFERWILPRIAKALPSWVMPDHLTVLGLIATALIGTGYVLSHVSPYWLCLSIFSLGLHWFGDSLDGTLARVRKQERERYGYYVDRTADAISTVVICFCFGLSPFAQLSSALILGVSYLLLQMFAEICAYTSGRFPLSFGRLGPTEARMGLAAFNAALVFWIPPNVSILGLSMSAVDVLLLAVSAGICGTFLFASAKEARRLDLLDRARWTLGGDVPSQG